MPSAPNPDYLQNCISGTSSRHVSGKFAQTFYCALLLFSGLQDKSQPFYVLDMFQPTSERLEIASTIRFRTTRVVQYIGFESDLDQIRELVNANSPQLGAKTLYRGDWLQRTPDGPVVAAAHILDSLHVARNVEQFKAIATQLRTNCSQSCLEGTLFPMAAPTLPGRAVGSLKTYQTLLTAEPVWDGGTISVYEKVYANPADSPGLYLASREAWYHSLLRGLQHSVEAAQQSADSRLTFIHLLHAEAYPWLATELVASPIWRFMDGWWRSNSDIQKRGYQFLEQTHDWSVLSQLCRAAKESSDPELFVVISPRSASVTSEVEWGLIENRCRPAMVLLDNVNLPGGPGWLRAHLLGTEPLRDMRARRPDWVEVFNGTHEEEAKKSGLGTNMFRERSFSLLRRKTEEENR